MNNILCLDVDDIKTHPMGYAICIKVNEEFSISFSREAVEEFIRDYNELVKQDEENKVDET